MLIEKLTLRGFSGLKHIGGAVDVEFPSSGLIAIIGPNGSGKTTLIDNVHPYRLMPSKVSNFSPRAFSFYDHTYGKAVKELFFSYHDKRYRSLIEIDTERSKQSAYLFEITQYGEEPVAIGGYVSDGNVSTYDTLVEMLFGPPSVFFSAAFVPQGRRLASTLSPTALRSIFVLSLELDKIQSWHEKAKEYVRLGEREVDALYAKIEAGLDWVRKAIEEQRVSVLSLDQEAKGCIEQIGNIDALRAEVERLEKLSAELRNTLEAKKVELARAKAAHDEAVKSGIQLVAQLESRIRLIDQSMNSIKGNIQAAERAVQLECNIAYFNGKIESLLLGLNDKLGFASSDEVVQWMLKELGASIDEPTLRVLERKLNGLCAQYSAGRYGPVKVPCDESLFSKCPLYKEQPRWTHSQIVLAHERVTACLEVIAEVDKCQKELDVAKASLESIRMRAGDVDALRGELSSLEKQKAELERELKRARQSAVGNFVDNGLQSEVEQLAAELAHVGAKLAEYSRKLRDAELHAARLDSICLSLDRALSSIDGIGKHCDEIEADILALGSAKHRLDHDYLLRSALSERGVQTMLLTRGIQDVERVANELLGLALGGRYKISFSFIRELKSGDSKMEFSLSLIDSVLDTKRDLSTLSGGESVMVMEAVSRALAICCMPGIRTIVEDEADGALDTDRRGEILQLKRAALSAGHIVKDIFVTHSSEIVAGADHVLEAPLFC